MTTAENIDCMVGMRRYPDGWFDLAIVDPPYGLGKRTTDGGSKKNSQTKFMADIRRTNWDDRPPGPEYFSELFRVSKNQIIWGGNYFLDQLGKTKCLVVWDKMTYIPTMSQIEIGWTSFDRHSCLIKINSNDIFRQHPTQKPIALYKWLLENYARPGDKILDTHLGSGSSRIAAHDMGFAFHGFELDPDYFQAQEARFAAHIKKPTLFTPAEMYTFEQQKLF